MSDTNIKVVVRVRPFNDREKQQTGVQECVVHMSGITTTLLPDPRYVCMGFEPSSSMRTTEKMLIDVKC